MKLNLHFEGISRRQLAKILILGAVAGIVWLTMVRAILYSPDGVHYHANFAVFIDGEQDLFEEPTFYEEVSSCGAEGADPRARVHMHDQIGDVVHVHEASATWGNFFENIGFVLGDNVLYARTNTYVDGQGGELRFILNGEQVRNIASKTIASEDVLLISFGDESTDLEAQYATIDASAAEYNQEADPSACKGSGEDGSIGNRFKHAIGL